MKTIGEAAKFVGVTERTLRYYDKIGLLKPTAYTESGYRLYTERDMIKLKNIMALQCLNLSLKEIEKFLREDKPLNVGKYLHKQKEVFIKEREHLTKMIGAIEQLEKKQRFAVEDIVQRIQLLYADEKVKE